MFSIFKVKNSELESIIRSLEANKSNNYKDNAQSCLVDLKKRYEELCNDEKLTKKQIDLYSGIIKEYDESMMFYTHKDQKPYWT